MIPKVQLPVPRRDFPRILHLPSRDPLFCPRLPPDVPRLEDDEHLRDTNRPQAERVAQCVRSGAVDLAGDHAGAVRKLLLEPDGGRAPVVGRDVDVEPGHVQPDPRVDGDGAEEGAEELDRVRDRGEEEGVADEAADGIGEEEEGGAQCQAVGGKGQKEKAAAAHDVDGDGEVLGL